MREVSAYEYQWAGGAEIEQVREEGQWQAAELRRKQQHRDISSHVK